MKHSTNRFHFSRAFLPLVAAGGLTALSSPAAPVVLLRDSFNGVSTPSTANINYNLQGRQTGLLAPVPYTKTGNVQVGNTGEPYDGGSVLLCAANGRAALNYNFTNAVAAGGLKISFLMDPNSHNQGDTTTWNAVNLGMSEANTNVFVNTAVSHFGILFRANGGIQAFDGSTVVSGAETWAPPGNYSLQLHRVDLVITDPVNGHPFDTTGDTKIDVYIDGGVVPVYSFTKVGGYPQGFVNFVGNSIGDFEDLEISAINPPTPPTHPWRVNAWSGDVDSEISSAYTYTHAYSFGNAGGSPVINGVPFTGVGGGNPTVAGRFSVAGVGNAFGDDGGANLAAGSGSINLGRSFIYGGAPGTLTVQGLTPGQPYVLTLYTKSWDASGNRILKFTASGNQKVIDQNTYGRFDAAPRNGTRITYAYTADASGTLVVTMAPFVPASTCHLYGFSNREGTPTTSSWNFAEWTSDATSGVDPSTYLYTHANNFGSASTVTINGLPFTGNGAQNPSVSGSYSVANHFALYGGGYVPTITGNGQALANQFIYDGRPAALTVQGLVPGRRYVLSLYSAAFGGPGRILNFLANGELATIDQGEYTQNKGIVINYPYTAPPSGEQTVQIFTVNPGWSFHFCGYANREEAAATTLVINSQPQDAVVVLGATATFSAAIAGPPPVTYQWYYASAPIPGATSSSLSVLADFPDVAGLYSLVADNGSSSITSRLAALTVRLPVAGLFNTGVDSGGVALADNSIDPHYQIIVNPDGPSPNAIVENSTAFPIVAGPWLANSASAKWIGPRFDTATAAALATGGGIYVFRTTFDCTGLDLATIVITGGWAIDNTGLNIRVNGVDTGVVNGNGFGGLTPFTLTPANSTFVNGLNTLDFVVRNDDAVEGYIGLYVGNLAGTASLPNTPPGIIAQPQGAVRGTGENFTLAVSASGSSPLSYQWRKGGVDITDATNSSLTLNNLLQADTGVYSVFVFNPFGTATSSNATLVVRDTIPGLFNTGVDDLRVALADGLIDPHYKLVVNPDGASQDSIVENSTVFPIVAGPWVANDAASKWIGPRLDTSAAAGGDYTYRLTVDLTGFDTTSIEVSGEWSSDNGGLDILVNGVSSGQINAAQFVAYTPFLLTNLFTSGSNTIDFKVNNAAAGYTGLRVRSLRGLGTLLPPGTRPFILTEPADIVGNYNEISTFRVVANGSTPLAFQWSYEGFPIPGANGPTHSVLVDFPDVAGNYSVEISNGAGSTNSRLAVLSVNEPPLVPTKGAATMMDTPMNFGGPKLLLGVTDPENNPVTLDSVATTSGQGGSVSFGAGLYTYLPPTGFTGLDTIVFNVRDSRGGVASGILEVMVISGALPSQNQVLLEPTPNGYRLRFAGIPGKNYLIQRSTDLMVWAPLTILPAPPHGLIEYEDETALPSAFYRTVAAP